MKFKKNEIRKYLLSLNLSLWKGNENLEQFKAQFDSLILCVQIEKILHVVEVLLLE